MAEGTVRSLGDENGGFLTDTDDVRAAHVRITTSMGFEWFVPMRELVTMLDAGEIGED